MEVPVTLFRQFGIFRQFEVLPAMRISVAIFVILISTCIVNTSVLDPVIENIIHLKATKPPSDVAGIWKKKTIWKPRWVKEWKSAKVMKPVWRKVWSPVQIREWVPIPKPPPGWDAISTPLAPVHPKPQGASLKDSLGHDSFPAQSAVPLWDPVPYPESQQPPPPPPQANAEGSCANGGCDNSSSHTFNHQQILEIIGPRYQPPDSYQNPENSETVNHLTRLPPEGSNWRQPQSDIQFDNRFKGFPGLPEFLVPPKSQPENDYRLQFPNHKPNNPVHQPPGFEAQNSHRWTPLPSDNKVKGHFITKAPDQPYKFHFPEVELRNRNNTTETFHSSDNSLRDKANSPTHDIRPQADGDFIQEAQLVGEYHYSEFDQLNVKPQPNIQEQVRVKQQQRQKVKPAEGERPVSQQFMVENKQTRTEIKQQDGQIQKKHIPNSSSRPFNNFQQQEAAIREIFPVFKPLLTANETHIPNQRLEQPKNNKNQEKLISHSSTKLVPVAPHQFNSTNIQQQREIYPVYEIPKRINLLPPNHRFSPNSEVRQQEKSFETHQNATKLVPVSPATAKKTENPVFNKVNSLQLVFATTAVDQKYTPEEFQKTTTSTEPYEVIFSSSLLSTTESVTKSPVFIVTPINLKT